jgi:hypothetical protein
MSTTPPPAQPESEQPTQPADAPENGNGTGGGGAPNGTSASQTWARVLAGLGTLAPVLLAGLGFSNGTIAGAFLNEEELLLLGLVLTAVAVLLGIATLLLKPTGWRTPVTLLAATVALMVGVAIATYAILIAPSASRGATMDVTLTRSGGQVSLSARIKSHNVPETEGFWIEIAERRYEPGGRYVQVGSPLYESEIGPDAQGNVDTTLNVPLPRGGYTAVSVAAWNGYHSGPCGWLELPGGAQLPRLPIGFVRRHARIGCTLVQVAH